ncbi:MAG: ankyrin repeat domain-containing protein [Verrucomicrobiota bacterium]
MLWFVGVAIALGVFAMWDMWRHGRLVDDREQFLLGAIITGALALVWVGLLVALLFARWIESRPRQQKGRRVWVSGWMLKCASLILVIVAMAILVSWLSVAGATEFALLRNGRVKLLEKRLIHHPERLERMERDSGKTLLELALEAENVDAVDMLLTVGARIDPLLERLDLTASLNDLEMLETLLRHGVDPDLPDGKGRTALHLAIAIENHAAAHLLIEEGADVYIRDNMGRTALDLMEENRLNALLELVEERGRSEVADGKPSAVQD